MLSEPVKALFESNTNARHAGDADRLAKEHKPNGVHVLTDLPYGIPDQLRKLDLYRPETQHEPLPVIIDFHGGGLYHGDKQNTMCRDMYLAKYGFAVVNANYRLVPQIGFQGQLHDALDAIIWTNEHAHDYGMDTNALFLIGDSAATLLILYLTAVLHSPVVASQLGMREAYGTAHILAIAGCSGMYRFEGGVHVSEVRVGLRMETFTSQALDPGVEDEPLRNVLHVDVRPDGQLVHHQSIPLFALIDW